MPEGQVWKRVWRSDQKMGVENYFFWSEIGSGFGELGSTLPPLPPPHRLPLGIPIKIAIIEKIESAPGTTGSRALPFAFSPASPQHKEASAEERAPSKNSQEYPTGNSTPLLSKFKKDLHRNSNTFFKEIQGLFKTVWILLKETWS